VFPVPDLQEGRITSGIIDDLLCQGADKIIKDPQPVSRNVFDTPSHLCLSKEW
jgi:hypothetical protein